MARNKETRRLNTAEWMMIGSGGALVVLAVIMALAAGDILHPAGAGKSAF